MLTNVRLPSEGLQSNRSGLRSEQTTLLVHRTPERLLAPVIVIVCGSGGDNNSVDSNSELKNLT